MRDLAIKLLGVVVVVPIILCFAVIAVLGLVWIAEALGLIPVSWWLRFRPQTLAR